MKKSVLAIIAILFTLSLMGCPAITTQPLEAESVPIVEMLFDLPEEASIVSESFVFDLTNGDFPMPDLTVTGSYVIQNDGFDAVLDMLYPTLAETSFYQVPFIDATLRIEVDRVREDAQWTFALDAEDLLPSPELTHVHFHQHMVHDLADPASVTTHRYDVECPTIGSGETMTVTVPEGTFILHDSYMETTDGFTFTNVRDRSFAYLGPGTAIPAFPNRTTLRFYTVGQPAVLSANYDFNGVHEIGNLADMIEQQSGSIYQARYLVHAMAASATLGVHTLHVHEFLIETRYGDASVLSMFTLSVPLPGNGAVTTVDVTFPGLQPGTEVAGDVRTLFYDFYLDDRRYDGGTIPVTLAIVADILLVAATYDVSEASVIEAFPLGTRLHFVFSTAYEETASG